jgi:hypothetical protein
MDKGERLRQVGHLRAVCWTRWNQAQLQLRVMSLEILPSPLQQTNQRTRFVILRLVATKAATNMQPQVLMLTPQVSPTVLKFKMETIVQTCNLNQLLHHPFRMKDMRGTPWVHNYRGDTHIQPLLVFLTFRSMDRVLFVQWHPNMFIGRWLMDGNHLSILRAQCSFTRAARLSFITR